MTQWKEDIKSGSDVFAILGETGWPVATGSKTFQTGGGARADADSLNQFPEDFICSSNSANLPYFFFELWVQAPRSAHARSIDEAWKTNADAAESQQVEASWGLFDKDKKLKDGVKIPSCSGSTSRRRR